MFFFKSWQTDTYTFQFRVSRNTCTGILISNSLRLMEVFLSVPFVVLHSTETTMIKLTVRLMEHLPLNLKQGKFTYCSNITNNSRVDWEIAKQTKERNLQHNIWHSQSQSNAIYILDWPQQITAVERSRKQCRHVQFRATLKRKYFALTRTPRHPDLICKSHSCTEWLSTNPSRSILKNANRSCWCNSNAYLHSEEIGIEPRYY
jgi:hypothetical protein